MSDAEAARSVNRGLLIVLGGIAALALLFLFVINPLLLGDDDTEGPITVPATEPEEPLPTPAPTVEPTDEGTPVPETFEVFSARDPFQQLVSVATGDGGAAADTGAGTGDGTGAGTGDGTGAGTGDGTGAGPGTDDGTGTDAGSKATVGATTVSLVDVFTDDDGEETILVTVNGTGHEVSEGEVFADRFKVLDISGSCATLLFGDSRFVLCEGEQIRK